MPIYEYRCDDCDTVFEVIVSDYQHVAWCGNCGRECKRVFPKDTSFRLKGEGWYAPSNKKK